MSTVLNSLRDQYRSVVVRAVGESVSAASGSTPLDALSAIERVANKRDFRQESRQSRRGASSVVPNVLPYDRKDIPAPTPGESRRPPRAVTTSVVRRIARQGLLSAADARTVSGRLAAVTGQGDQALLVSRYFNTKFGTGEISSESTKIPSLYSMESVPSAEYLGEQIARRVAYGWGEYDLNFFEGVALEGDQPITFSFGASGSASIGVQKAVNRLVLWLFTRKGSYELDPDYGSTLLTQIVGGDIISARVRVVTAITSALSQWQGEDSLGLPDDERITGLRVENVIANPQSIYAKIRVFTAAGEEVTAVLPVSKPEIDYGY